MTIDLPFLNRVLEFHERVLQEANTFIHFALENEPENYVNRTADDMLAEFGDILADTYHEKEPCKHVVPPTANACIICSKSVELMNLEENPTPQPKGGVPQW